MFFFFFFHSEFVVWNRSTKEIRRQLNWRTTPKPFFVFGFLFLEVLLLQSWFVNFPKMKKKKLWVNLRGFISGSLEIRCNSLLLQIFVIKKNFFLHIQITFISDLWLSRFRNTHSTRKKFFFVFVTIVEKKTHSWTSTLPKMETRFVVGDSNCSPHAAFIYSLFFSKIFVFLHL